MDGAPLFDPLSVHLTAAALFLPSLLFSVSQIRVIVLVAIGQTTANRTDLLLGPCSLHTHTNPGVSFKSKALSAYWISSRSFCLVFDALLADPIGVHDRLESSVFRSS